MVPARPDRVLALALETFSDGQTVPSGVNRGLPKQADSAYRLLIDTQRVAFSQQADRRLRLQDHYSLCLGVDSKFLPEYGCESLSHFFSL